MTADYKHIICIAVTLLNGDRAELEPAEMLAGVKNGRVSPWTSSKKTDKGVCR